MTFSDAFGNPWEIAKAGWVAVATVVTWIGRDHIKQDREIATKTDARITAVESDLATKFGTLTDTMHKNHEKIYELLIDRLPPPRA